MMLERSRLVGRARRSRAAHLLRGAIRRYRERNLPVLSVVVPMHNSGQFLPGCVESLLAHAGKVQVVLVDDGSTDDSYAIARALHRRTSQRDAALPSLTPGWVRRGTSEFSTRNGCLPGLLRRR